MIPLFPSEQALPSMPPEPSSLFHESTCMSPSTLALSWASSELFLYSCIQSQTSLSLYVRSYHSFILRNASFLVLQMLTCLSSAASSLENSTLLVSFHPSQLLTPRIPEGSVCDPLIVSIYTHLGISFSPVSLTTIYTQTTNKFISSLNLTMEHQILKSHFLLSFFT